MRDFCTSSSFFAVCLTLVAYSFGAACQKKWKWAILNPILIAAAVIILVPSLMDIPNSVYQTGCAFLTYLLTPATICLAISFYDQFQKLKAHLAAAVLGILAGTIASIGTIWAMAQIFKLDEAITGSLLPKSVTTAIGVALCGEIGGIAAITTAAIVITGIIGNISGPALCKLFRLKSEVAQGVAFGTSSHVVGTAKASELSQLTGAVSSLSLTVAGIITAVILSFLAQFM